MPDFSGSRIVITRAAHQAGELQASLQSLGAEVILLPLIGIAPPVDMQPLREAALRADSYDWIIFTSANAVRAFAAQQPQVNRTRIAAIGPATRDAAEQAGFAVTLVPKEYVAESLIDAFANENLGGRRILIPSAAVTRDVVPNALRNLGATVDVVEAYRNVIPPEAASLARQTFQQPYPDWVVFASPSAIHRLVDLVGVEPLRYSKVATIGSITSSAVRQHGVQVAAEAAVQSTNGIIEAMQSFLA